jgi:parallel beta-helix repeat protein
MKTLDEVEARIIVHASSTPGNATNSFIINAPGSYYLTGNITGAPGKHGISIQANDVTLDLNGFALIGVGGGASRGVNVPLAQSGFCIHDGSVRGWTSGGVQAGAAVTLAERLRLSDNVGAIGLVVGNGSMVKDCVATGNATGFSLPDRTQVSDCIATVNTGVGFDCTSYVSIIDCTASRNGGNGIVAEASCSVIRCTATRNIPNGYGIKAGAGCTIADCTASSNGLDGIWVDAGSTVRGCTVHANESRGISANNGGCHVTGNSCHANSDTGIIVQGGDRNRVDGNSCILNVATGFIINGFHNLVIRNSASGNGAAYAIPAGNAAGPIVVMTAGGTLTSTSPWANFSH